MKPSDYALLAAFRGLFEGRAYLHRNSNQGDKAVRHLFEDLRNLNRSSLLSQRIDEQSRVINTANKRVGIVSRRGDGSFGELVPVAVALREDGFLVSRGPLASIEIGAETKILAKAMIKQIDRVVGDLLRQVEEFKKGGNPICIGIVGVNCAPAYTSFEGDRAFPTDGTARFKHPAQEAPEAISRLERLARPSFDEFLILKFKASNVAPFPFEWVDENETLLSYSALLARVSTLYQRRFNAGT
jgi:hypothetical protein